MLSLPFVLAGDFSIGKEGPFVHLSTIVAHNIMELPVFKALRNDSFLKKQVYHAAVAGGVANTFGTPYGGVIFSIETTSSFYMVSNLWKGFVTAFFCMLIHSFFSSKRYIGLFGQTSFD